MAAQVKALFHFTPSDKLSDVQIVNQLCAQMGLKFELHFSNHLPGHEGQKTRYYQLDLHRFNFLQEVLERRAARRAVRAAEFETEASGSPRALINENQVGDPSATTEGGGQQQVFQPLFDVVVTQEPPATKQSTNAPPPTLNDKAS
jgi:hypothetical protein